MELNRNQYFMIGLVVLFLGMQFRYVESFTLNAKTTKALAEQFQQPQLASANPFPSLLSMAPPIVRRTVTPPKWLGWSLVSTGAVLVLHSLAMRKPGG